MSDKLTIEEVRYIAERIVLREGGWITVASKLEMTGETLKRIFNVSSRVSAAREMLTRLEAQFGAFTRP